MFWVFQQVFLWLFKVNGWVIEGSIPPETKKAILVGGAHSSNWDLMGTFGTLFSLQRKFHFIIKKEALRFPLKNFLLHAGAIPIDRKGKHNIVDQVAEFIKSQEKCLVCIAPEGTRSPTKNWKSGFYHMAKLAEVPIILCYMNYDKKVVSVGEPHSVDSSEEETMTFIKNHFKKAVPKHPENVIY